MLEVIKEKILPIIFAHKIEAIFFGLTSLFFVGSVTMFLSLQTDKASKNAIIIQKNQTDPLTTLVDIGGAVKKPGVYPVKSGQRIYELVEKAGGLTDGADLAFYDKMVNRAQKLNDQAKIYIPFQSTENFSGSENFYETALISVNSADIAELETLPGI